MIQLESGNNVNNFQLSIRIILREPGDRPEWLPKMSLDKGCEDTMMPVECADEMKARDHTLTYSVLVTTEHHGIGEIIDCNKFNSFQKLLRVTAYVKKIILRFRSLVTDKQAPVDLTLTSEDIERAETDWVIQYQRHLTKDNKFDLWKHQHCFRDGGGYSFSGSWLHLVSMRLEYRMCVYLLIVVKKTVLTLYTGEVENSNIRFR